ncbi:hypothetical protein GWO43_21110 [candidate division KSB1 bacterium]|nr:hypothetical protein [candidate division KSB1 bacterium]NIR72053.1 hypothetical protein [candidate division KSB1 bacterium]NIS26566.1 hypothetical protein [candidate division KSB1 bacterium]NIT73328.1 hypothetical protein [candidate division KSB1 bacterium]NIU27176.1 hypothetical protein [candidate division KSB1 bacterium]
MCQLPGRRKIEVLGANGGRIVYKKGLRAESNFTSVHEIYEPITSRHAVQFLVGELRRSSCTKLRLLNVA